MIHAELITCVKCKRDLPDFEFLLLTKHRAARRRQPRCEECRGVRRRHRSSGTNLRRNLEEHGSNRDHLYPDPNVRVTLSPDNDKLAHALKDLFRR